MNKSSAIAEMDESNASQVNCHIWVVVPISDALFFSNLWEYRHTSHTL